MAEPKITPAKLSLIDQAKKYKLLLVLFFVLVAGLVTWLAIVQIKKSKQNKLAAGEEKPADTGHENINAGAGTPDTSMFTPGPPAPGRPIAKPPTDAWPIQVGSKGDHVKELQYLINKINPAAKLQVDGDFGKLTKDAVIKYMDAGHYPVTAQGFVDIANKANGTKVGADNSSTMYGDLLASLGIHNFMGYNSHVKTGSAQKQSYGCSGGTRYIWDGKGWVYVGMGCKGSDSQIF